MQEIQFDYFRKMEAEQYSFYRVPKVLFTAECFKPLSCEAKILYGLMLDRMGLSIKNRWLDEKDRVYIIFTVENVMELLNCGRQKAVKSLAELDTEKGIGLIEKKRLGLGKPSVIYVKNFMVKEISDLEPERAEREEIRECRENPMGLQKCEKHTSGSMENELQEVPCQNPDSQKYENQTSSSMDNGFQEMREPDLQKYENQISGSVKSIFQKVPKSVLNKTDINKTEYNKTKVSETDYGLCGPVQSNPSNLSHPSSGQGAVPMDVKEEMDIYRNIIRERIGYDCFQVDRDYQTEDVDELVELMVDVMLMPDSSVLRIAGADRSVAIVKNRFMKIDHEHIQYALECLRKKTTKVGNIKAYLLTTLYNTTLTISNYYQAEVNHDMYGGEWSG